MSNFRRVRIGLSAVLCGALTGNTFAAVPKPSPARPLDKDGRSRLMLSRFTFGPTPSELQSIRAIGVDAWMEQQLVPDRIPDSAFEARMDVYPALRMTQEERLARYPEPNTIRQLAKSGRLPADPELRAIVSDQVEFYQMAQQAKAAKAEPATTAPSTMTAAQMQQQATVANLEQSTQPMAKADVEAILAVPSDARYARLLSMPPADLIALRKGARGPLEGKLVDGMSPLQKETLLALSGTNRMMNVETQSARLLRDIYSQRQLEAVMTDFWINHFNVYSGKDGQEPSLIPQYEQTIRDHALGRFEDLLVATAQDPAMLRYLDNATSTGPDSQAAVRQRRNPKANQTGLNENYARELMELHTLGVNGGYTQHDVTEVAKVFTGWTLERPNDGGQFTFNANRHQPGDKIVLGKTVRSGGEDEGRTVLHMLATNPATAHFISTEIAQRFVSDTPPPAMVDRMAKTFLKSSGDIKAVLRTMVHSPEFFTTSTVNAKLKTPLEYVTSAVRASGADVTNPLPLVQSLQQLGMPLYGCQPPTGYKWDEASWLSSSALVNRMNFALALSTNRIGGVTTDWTPALSAPTMQTVAFSDDAARKETQLEVRLFEVPVSEQTRSAVISQGTDATAQQAAQQFAQNTNATAQQAAQQFAQNTNGRVLTQAEKDAQQQDRLDEMMMRRGPIPQRGQAVQQRGIGATPIRNGPPPADKQAAAMAGLLLGSPEFQRR